MRHATENMWCAWKMKVLFQHSPLRSQDDWPRSNESKTLFRGQCACEEELPSLAGCRPLSDVEYPMWWSSSVQSFGSFLLREKVRLYRFSRVALHRSNVQLKVSLTAAGVPAYCVHFFVCGPGQLSWQTCDFLVSSFWWVAHCRPWQNRLCPVRCSSTKNQLPQSRLLSWSQKSSTLHFYNFSERWE